MADADTGGVEPVKIYENTFRLEPTEEQRFKPSVAVNAMKETLEASMSYTLEKDEGGQYVWEYDREEAADVAKEVSQECTARVKAALGEQPRYKLICHVVVSENVQQSFRVSSRCLWDKAFDNCATAEWRHPGGKLIALAMCFALYYE
ncbi:hypothetical protein EMIHUDRAFT_210607 [Emiliania huxleyi CCMP1516]|uniref:Uncharacterized protein n=4 Tax=Emiliania huxleyi TaxID=2903 RepID=A0A0D3IYD6_EMIH1|nr:hypothetical protein EMIHUDRAFT_210607 [Emiliania huxleyi CCMP1516]EOD16271.1 hypothetical protein EMIHUDRAFT_210607 [Emiliania huxleyi CCMP1516]|mmetsp:Transcript_37827/g.113135  ORF Transcript_37827/g.113135 Transcript_37827/m.113135 type:complete len:148 (+) Transcript_37827:44-487(+)|eukprot:XP_005768700.1 hypothetical protein EMIHUDRAFT_210607 [Emiliania huxleyi CCMP1516]